jgi:DNA-directed RNA polymerase specialized sigma24 family protein
MLFRDYLTVTPSDSDPASLAAEPLPVVVGRESLLVDDVLDFNEPELDFNEPEDDLRVEVIVADLDVPGAEREADRAEFQASARTALSSLPRTWRHVLELRFVEDVGFSEVSRRTGVPEDEIPAVVEHARALLRARLEEAGCRFTTC